MRFITQLRNYNGEGEKCNSNEWPCMGIRLINSNWNAVGEDQLFLKYKL